MLVHGARRYGRGRCREKLCACASPRLRFVDDRSLLGASLRLSRPRVRGEEQKGPTIMAITKSEALQQVQSMVAEVTRARFEGGAYAKLARAHGYADGYMKALLDLGIVERAELLRAIGEERGRVVASDLAPRAA